MQKKFRSSINFQFCASAGDGGLVIAGIRYQRATMARLSGSTSSLPECICNIFDIGGWMLYQIKAKAVPLICDTCNAEIFRRLVFGVQFCSLVNSGS